MGISTQNTTSAKLNRHSFPVSPLYQNNCLLHAVFGMNEDCGLIRHDLSKNIRHVIESELSSSNEEDKLLILHHLDFNYDLGLEQRLNLYMESANKNKIAETVIFHTQEKISQGAMLDMVFATQAVSDMSGKDITVNFNHGNTPMKYVIKSNHSIESKEHVHIRLNNEHYSRSSTNNIARKNKSRNNIVRNYVVIADYNFFMINQIFISKIDFMVFNLFDRITALFENCFTLKRHEHIYNGAQPNSLDNSNQREPSWQSISNHPNRDQIAKKWGYNDLYQMATTQDRAHKANQNAQLSTNLIKFIKDQGSQSIDVEKMNEKILSFVQDDKSSSYLYENIS